MAGSTTWSRIALDAAVALRMARSIVLTGPPGVGKTTLARQLKRLAKIGGAFVEVDCGSLRGEVARSELHGVEKGAFTGAVASKPGLIARADGGVLFLDEVGDLDDGAQRLLLKAIEGEHMPVGATQPVKARVRIIAATNKDLRTEVAAGRFRRDLFDRLARHIVEVPKLEERPDVVVDIARAWVADLVEDGALFMGSRLARKAEERIVTFDFSDGQARAVQAHVARAAGRAWFEAGMPEDAAVIIEARHFEYMPPPAPAPPMSELPLPLHGTASGPRNPPGEIERAILEALRPAGDEGLKLAEIDIKAPEPTLKSALQRLKRDQFVELVQPGKRWRAK